MDQPQDRQSQRQAPESRPGSYVLSGQEFTRDTNYIQDRIVADTTAITAAGRVEPDKVGRVSGGLTADAQAWPVEAGRYRLVAARACPWANRTIIVRRLLGLEDAISLGTPGPTHDERSWTFDLDPDGRDPVLGTERLQENYFTRFPDYPRGITVPAIVDIPTGAVVTNDYPQITLDFSTQWTAHHRDGAPDLLPEESLDEMHEVITRIFTEVNNGVYRCGFAGSQEAYDSAYDRLWTALDWLEERLATRRYLMGETITEADVRLFTTLVRFDPVYHGHFKCNRNKLDQMPALWGYARDLFQTPGFGDTIDFAQIKSHYYEVHRDINPTGIVPKGPKLAGWLGEHRREELGGSPFGDGTAPGPVRDAERVTPGHNPMYPA
jgi:putative glutathione S-transferase